MRIYEKVFTPDEAIDIVLNRNENFRKIKDYKVLEYKKLMQDGNWCENNGQTISFYDNGNLADGQHRLKALHDAGVSLKFIVVDGIPMSATETIDSGLSRSSVDSIKFKLRETDNTLERGAFAVTKQVLVLRRNGKSEGQPMYNVGYTEKDARDECIRNISGYNDATKFGNKILLESNKSIRKTEAGAIYYYLTHDIGLNSWYVKGYFEKLVGCPRNSKSVFNTTISNLERKELSSSQRYDELIWGWNSYVRGCNAKRCQRPEKLWFELPANKSYYNKENDIESLPGCIGVASKADRHRHREGDRHRDGYWKERWAKQKAVREKSVDISESEAESPVLHEVC